MSDKLLSGVSVDIVFSSGETPSPAKLTAITAQLKRASTKLEQAVGDVHSQSWPYFAGSETTLSGANGISKTTGVVLSGAPERDLDIASLARLMGPASNLNPKTIGDVHTIVENTPVGVNAFATRYPIVSGSAVSTTDASLATLVDIGDMVSAGQWAYLSSGKVACITPTVGGTFTYTTDPRTYGGGLNYSSASFNVIPDPNQIANGLGCTVGAVAGDGKRTVTLPAISHQQSDLAGQSVAITVDNTNFNKQLKLPAVLSTLSPGDDIPSGFLYLKNETTNEVYEDASYYWNNDTTYKIDAVELGDAIDAGHVFSTITVGTNLTQSIDDLRDKLYHSHDRSYGEPFVDVNGIYGQYEVPGERGVYAPSEIPSNYFSQYLHRDGYNNSLDQNVNDGNAMRGNLVLGVVGADAGSYVADEGETYAVRFGGVGTANPIIKKNADTEEYLLLKTRDQDIRLEVENVAVSDPTQTAAKTINTVGAVLVTEEGLRGSENSTPVSIYAQELTLTTPGGAVPYEFEVSLGTNITSKKWYGVTFALEAASGVWVVPPAETVLAGVADYEISWTQVGPTSALFIRMTGAGYTAATAYDCRVVIHYQP